MGVLYEGRGGAQLQIQQGKVGIYSREAELGARGEGK